MRRCLHAKHMDDRMKVRHAGARLAAHVLGATAANRLHRAPLPVPLSPCSVCRVGLLCVCCSEASRMTSRPTVVSAHLGVAVPAPIAAMLLAIIVSALARAATIVLGAGPSIPCGDGRRAPKADALEADAPEAGAPEAEPLVVMSHPSVTEPPEPGLRVQDRRAQDRRRACPHVPGWVMSACYGACDLHNLFIAVTPHIYHRAVVSHSASHSL